MSPYPTPWRSERRRRTASRGAAGSGRKKKKCVRSLLRHFLHLPPPPPFPAEMARKPVRLVGVVCVRPSQLPPYPSLSVFFPAQVKSPYAHGGRRGDTFNNGHVHLLLLLLLLLLRAKVEFFRQPNQTIAFLSYSQISDNSCWHHSLRRRYYLINEALLNCLRATFKSCIYVLTFLTYQLRSPHTLP